MMVDGEEDGEFSEKQYASYNTLKENWGLFSKVFFVKIFLFHLQADYKWNPPKLTCFFVRHRNKRDKYKLTWHELNDVKTMQLVPTKINSTYGHLGGVGEVNAGAFEPEGFAKK